MNITVIFEDAHLLVKGLKKNSYESNMNIFRERYGDVFREFTEAVTEEADYAKVADEFATAVFEENSKNGKIKGGKLMDLNMLMVYYAFPVLQMQEGIDTGLMCDSVRDSWNRKFNTSIDYTTYDKILDGFKSRLFGMF